MKKTPKNQSNPKKNKASDVKKSKIKKEENLLQAKSFRAEKRVPYLFSLYQSIKNSFANLKFSMLTGVATTMFTVVSISSGLIIGVFYIGMQQVAFQFGNTNLVNVERFIGEKISNFFSSSSGILEGAHHSLTSLDLIDEPDRALISMRNFLQINPDVSSIYIAFEENGHFYMIKRMEDGSFSERRVSRDEENVFVRWKHENVAYYGEFPTVASSDLESGYDPRVRSWYKTTFNSNNSANLPLTAGKENVTWSSPYIFASDKKIGITASQKLINADQQVLGVIAIDLPLQSISEFLSEFPLVTQEKGFLFLTDKEKILLARSFPTENGEVTILPQSLAKVVSVSVGQKQFSPIKIYESNNQMIRGSIIANTNVYNPSEFFLNISEERTEDFIGKQFGLVKKVESFDSFFIKAYNWYQDRITGEENKGNIAFISNMNERYSTFTYDGEVFLSRLGELKISEGFNINLGLVAPFAMMVGPLNLVVQTVLTICAMLLIIVFLTSLLVAGAITTPIAKISNDMLRVKNFQLDDDDSDVNTKFEEIDQMQNTFKSMKQGLLSFKKYVPTEIVSQLVKQGLEAQVSGKKTNVTILFSDITNFTEMTEKTESDILIKQLRIYFNSLSRIIAKYSGTLDKYIGDAIMALWGAPTTSPTHAIGACLAAIKCTETLVEMNKEFKKKKLNVLNTRFGINTGEAIVGNIGSDARLNYTAIGDSVNIAARLESINKVYGTSILISESTYKEAKEFVEVRQVDLVKVYGKERPTKIYELLGLKGKVSRQKVQMSKMFNKAFEVIDQKKWSEAIQILKKISATHPDDKVSKLLIDRCCTCIESDNPKKIDFVFEATSK